MSTQTTALGWLSKNHEEIEKWNRYIKKRAKENSRDLAPPIAAFKEMVKTNPLLHVTADKMFSEAYELKKTTPLGWEPEPMSFDDFISSLNEIMHTAPKAYQSSSSEDSPSGMIGFPINALLAWPMGTSAGYSFFASPLVNRSFKEILTYWSRFLVSPDSRYVLTNSEPEEYVIPWLSPQAQKEMMSVAYMALGEGCNQITADSTFADVFQCNPSDRYYGFKSWDDFFTRKFIDKVRPVSSPDDDSVITNACESAPLAIKKNVALRDSFWLKGQPYSLENMMNFDELTPYFEGGTVYQAFLSALSYHRWHSPVNGTIRKAYVVDGTYYLENRYQGFANPNGADPYAPNNSQPFITSVATRAVIFIQADNPDIGLICVVPVGMAEVSSCEITVKEGDRVKKGDQLGMFHFGGSTHCLIFNKDVKLDFETYFLTPSIENSINIRVKTKIATVIRN